MTDEILTRYQQAQTLEQGILSKRIILNDAVFPHWIGSHECFWYERDTHEGKVYRLVDARAASNEAAFDHKALAGALEAASGQTVNSASLPIKVTNITLVPTKVQFQAFDQSWVFYPDKMTCKLEKISDVETLPANHLCSPDGQKIAFVKDHNLWVRDLINGNERALTEDGNSNSAYATAVAAFGAPCTQAVQAIWSPDSRRLLTYQLNSKQVASTAVVQQVPGDGSIRPQFLECTVAYPGDNSLESYRLLTIDFETGKQQAVLYDPLPVCRGGNGFFSQEKFGWWANNSRQAYFVDVTRGAKTVRVVQLDSQTGNTQVLFEESSDTYIKLSHSIGLYERPLLYPLPDSNELIWFSERSGWGHLYLYDLNTGELKHPLTEGEWLVRNILHIDTERRELIVQTAARDPSVNPYYRDVCKIDLDTGAINPLISGPFEHVVLEPSSSLLTIMGIFSLNSPGVCGTSPSGHYFVVTRSRVNSIPVSLLIDRNGKEILTLEVADPFGLPADWQWPEPVKLTAADGQTEIHGIVYRPPGFSPEKSYPVLDFCCGHPGLSFVPQASFVTGAIYGGSYLECAAYAALGFVVVALEGRGTTYRHKAFQDTSYGDFVSANAFEDRVAGLRQLAEWYTYLDLDRVGIVAYEGVTGPVYGLLQHPDFYKVGVMAALQDSRFEPAFWTEMFEGVDQKQEIVFAEALASSLQGKLLLIHGMLDTVKPPAATLRLIDALQRANKDFDMLLLPNDGHEISRYMLRRTWDYLVTHLQGLEPPKEFGLITGMDLLAEAYK